MNRDTKNSELVRLSSRRQFLQRSTVGLSSLALATMLHEKSAGQDPPLIRQPHFAPKARSAIWLFMTGGPSHIDTFDYKPELSRRHGQTVTGADRFTGNRPTSGRCFGSPFKFHQHGQSGTWVSEIFPRTARFVDDMAFLHSCYGTQADHAPAAIELLTGMDRTGFPSLGSWLSYGLGTLNENLPSFVVLHGPVKPVGNDSLWSTGFLPKSHEPLVLDGRRREEIDNLLRAEGVSEAQQRSQLDLLRRLNQVHRHQHPLESELDARIQSFELAYRMQTAAPEAMDLSQEPEHVRERYGLNWQPTEVFGRQCLLARRLVERGVRFVQIFFTRLQGGEAQAPWDAHGDVRRNHGECGAIIDPPVAALLADLKYRGLLDSTLVIWGGEFGRTFDDESGNGRNHNLHANMIWMAGGGIRGGVHYGATDELGHKAIEPRVSVNDLDATILHLFGIDHTRLTYRFKGRDFRLTDVAGHVVQEIVA